MSITRQRIQSLSDELGEAACEQFINSFDNDLAKYNALLVLRLYLQQKKILPEANNLKQQHAYTLYTGSCPITFLFFLSDRTSENSLLVLTEETLNTLEIKELLRILNAHIATDSNGNLFARYADPPTNQIIYQTGSLSPCTRPDENIMVEDLTENNIDITYLRSLISHHSLEQTIKQVTQLLKSYPILLTRDDPINSINKTQEELQQTFNTTLLTPEQQNHLTNYQYYLKIKPISNSIHNLLSAYAHSALTWNNQIQNWQTTEQTNQQVSFPQAA